MTGARFPVNDNDNDNDSDNDSVTACEGTSRVVALR